MRTPSPVHVPPRRAAARRADDGLASYWLAMAMLASGIAAVAGGLVVFAA